MNLYKVRKDNLYEVRKDKNGIPAIMLKDFNIVIARFAEHITMKDITQISQLLQNKKLDKANKLLKQWMQRAENHDPNWNNELYYDTEEFLDGQK